MFRVDQSTNRITKLKSVRFSELGLRERSHLQEWLANAPDVFGEPLLVIQKEFAGFDDTRERLDLLALDRDGFLVIIENKLDDSGRDVVWQALKYASFCSTLSKSNILRIYQEFLDKNGGGDANANICKFLNVSDLSETKINTGDTQRLILVAAQFRKEVTSTVMWLLRRSVRIQCFKATPFKDGDQVYLNLEQIIPLPEAADLMIGIAEKEQEEEKSEREEATRHTLRRAFWRQTLGALEEAGIDLYANVSPGKAHWLSAGSGLSEAHYSMIFSRDCARVEFVFGRGDSSKNKIMFDHLYTHRNEIDRRFGTAMKWPALEAEKVSIILFEKSFDGFNSENWPEMIRWLVEHVRRIHAAFAPEIAGLRRALQEQSRKS